MSLREKKFKDSGGRTSRRELFELAAAGLGVAALAGCGRQKEAAPVSQSDKLAIVPKVYDGILNNPWMGWGLWGGPI